MSAPARGSKRSGSVRKAMVLGAPHTRKKRRLNGPDEKRARAKGATPNCKRQQQQDVHKDSRNNLHEAEGTERATGNDRVEVAKLFLTLRKLGIP